MTDTNEDTTKRYTVTRSISASRGHKRPEMINAMFRDAMKELAGPVFAAANRHEVALTFSTNARNEGTSLVLECEAIVRPVTKAMDEPWPFDQGKPLTKTEITKTEKK